MNTIKTKNTHTNILKDSFSKSKTLHKPEKDTASNGLSKNKKTKPGMESPKISSPRKQKETKKSKRKQVSLKEVQSINQEILLISWFKSQVNCGIYVSEDELKSKAEEILHSGQEIQLEDWLMNFRIRHNIEKLTLQADYDESSRKEWLSLLQDHSPMDIFVGGTSTLLHTLDLDGYVENIKPENQLSLFLVCSSSGLEKKELLVVGEDVLEENVSLASLPLKYCRLNEKPLINFNTIDNYLKEWDYNLKCNNRNVILILNVLETFVQHMNYDNIKVVKFKNKQFINSCFDRVVHCFKYYFRRNQIAKMLSPFHDSTATLSSNLNAVSLAWHSVPVRYIYNLFEPPKDGGLYLIHNDNASLLVKKPSLTEWSRTCNLPLNPKVHSLLDDYVTCDNALPSVNEGSLEANYAEPILDRENAIPSSGIDAYRAMKRLISYVHGQGASMATLQSARHIEDLTNHGALLEILNTVGVSENSTNFEVE